MCMTDMHNMLMKTPFRLPSPTATDADTSELIIQYTSILESGKSPPQIMDYLKWET